MCISREREKDDRLPQFVDEEDVVIYEDSDIRLNNYRAFGGSRLYYFSKKFRDYRSNRDIFLRKLSGALEDWIHQNLLYGTGVI